MELIVISDLHLSAGYNKETMKYSRNEDFFFDEEFKRFLEYFQRRNSRNKTYYHLIIAGDMFDFLQVVPDGHTLDDYKKKVSNENPTTTITSAERKYGLGTEADKTVWKLGLIAKGHEVFFQALAIFLSKGNCLSIITGNHDIELYWAKVRNALKDHIVETERDAITKQQIKSRIRFYPWFYYDKEYKTYIEHGNQYDTLNSFQYLLCPLFIPKRKITVFGPKRSVFESKPKNLWLPFGSFFVRYFFNKLEAIHPFADNIKPLTKYLRWAWKEDKIRFVKNWKYIPTMIQIYFKKGNLPGTAKRLLNIHNKRRLEKLAKKFNLPSTAVENIYTLHAPPFTDNKILGTFMCIFTLSILSFIIITAVASIVLISVSFIKIDTTGVHLLETPRYSLHNLVYPFIPLMIPFSKLLFKAFQQIPFKTIFSFIKPLISKIGKSKIGKFALDFSPDHFKKALRIKNYFEDEGIDVRTIVFGHTHNPDIRHHVKDKGTGDNVFRYFNTGTWTTVFSEEERIIREEKQFTLVWIKKKNGKPDPGLYRWNDCLKQPEKLILFEP
jgi:UDP-2,3-diacylglucosamine pyrophosphatase LpxH